MNVLITGGTGFIGSRLALKCLDKQHSVHVLGLENNPSEAENRRLIEARGAKVTLCNIIDKKGMIDLVQDNDLVYHLAAAQHEFNVPDQMFWDINVNGTRNMLEASVHAGVGRFVHASTIGVYGRTPEGLITENSPLRPNNIYGVTKLAAENIALSFSEKIPVVVVRISEAYGPADPRLLKLFKALKKKMFFLIGSGRNLHHPIYIDDLTDALILAASAEKALGRAFVLTGKEILTTNEMVNVIAAQLETTRPPIRVPLSLLVPAVIMFESLLRPLGIQPPLHRRSLDFFRKSTTFSSQEAFHNLGFLPKRTFEQGVQETTEWYRKMGYL